MLQAFAQAKAEGERLMGSLHGYAYILIIVAQQCFKMLDIPAHLTISWLLVGNSGAATALSQALAQASTTGKEHTFQLHS